MQNKQLLVMVRDGKVTLALELGQLTINVPDVSITIPKIGSDVHNHIGVNAGRPFSRFLRPFLMGMGVVVSALGAWKLWI